MSSKYDIIIIGSGPSGVSAAFPLAEAGLRVLMVDGGKQPDVQIPETDFLHARAHDDEQWKWMVGRNFHALRKLDKVSPKLRVPSNAYVFDGFGRDNKIDGKDFVTVGSLAAGGLSNAWGCGVACFTPEELSEFPFPASELIASYANIARRVGISGKVDDDMSDYFGLDEYSQPPIPLDVLHLYLSDRYLKKRKKLGRLGFKLGRSRVAVLSQDVVGRQACNLSGNCLWGCGRRSLYSAVTDLTELRKYKYFDYFAGFVVDRLVRGGDGWYVQGKKSIDNQVGSFTAKKVILAAGTLATTKIALKSLNHRNSVPVLSSPTAAFLLWVPRFFGEARSSGFGLGQLSFALELHDNITAFGSTFSTTGIPVFEFVRHVPLGRRYGIDLMRAMLSSCVVGNIFLPGDLTDAKAQLMMDDSMVVSGKYVDKVMPLMAEAYRKLRKIYWGLGAIFLPGSFTVGNPGGDIHYVGTLPMRKFPVVGETSFAGEIVGLEGVFAVDGACLPMLPEKSHTLTVMANADRIGRRLADSCNIDKGFPV